MRSVVKKVAVGGFLVLLSPAFVPQVNESIHIGKWFKPDTVQAAEEADTIQVKAIWSNGPEDTMSLSSTVRLYKNDQPTDQVIELKQSNDFTASFKELPQKDETGQKIIYTVKQDPSDQPSKQLDEMIKSPNNNQVEFYNYYSNEENTTPSTNLLPEASTLGNTVASHAPDQRQAVGSVPPSDMKPSETSTTTTTTSSSSTEPSTSSSQTSSESSTTSQTDQPISSTTSSSSTIEEPSSSTTTPTSQSSSASTSTEPSTTDTTTSVSSPSIDTPVSETSDSQKPTESSRHATVREPEPIIPWINQAIKFPTLPGVEWSILQQPLSVMQPIVLSNDPTAVSFFRPISVYQVLTNRALNPLEDGNVVDQTNGVNSPNQSATATEPIVNLNPTRASDQSQVSLADNAVSQNTDRKELADQHYGTVTIRFVDENGKEIHSKVQLKQAVGTKYDTQYFGEKVKEKVLAEK